MMLHRAYDAEQSIWCCTERICTAQSVWCCTERICTAQSVWCCTKRMILHRAYSAAQSVITWPTFCSCQYWCWKVKGQELDRATCKTMVLVRDKDFVQLKQLTKAGLGCKWSQLTLCQCDCNDNYWMLLLLSIAICFNLLGVSTIRQYATLRRQAFVSIARSPNWQLF